MALKSLTSKLVNFRIAQHTTLQTEKQPESESEKVSLEEPVALPLPLPYELQSQILSELSLRDVLSLRLACKSFNSIVFVHQNAIAKQHWPRLPYSVAPCKCSAPPGAFVPSAAHPQPALVDLFIQYRRCKIEHELAGTLTDLMYSKWLHIAIRPGIPRLDAMRLRLLSRIRLALRHLQDYLLRYRVELLSSAFSEQQQATKSDVSIQVRVMQRYCLECLTELRCLAHILHAILGMKLRPPSYATGVERIVRRWTKNPASAEARSKILLCGGLEGLNFIISLKPYAARIEAMRHYVTALDDPNERPPVTSKPGPHHEPWWLRNLKLGKGAGCTETRAVPALSFEQRDRLFKLMPPANEIILNPSGEAIAERQEEGSRIVGLVNVAEAMHHVLKKIEGEDELDFWEEL